MKLYIALMMVLICSVSFACAEQYTADNILASIPSFTDEELALLAEYIAAEQNTRYAAANSIEYSSLDELGELALADAEELVSTLIVEYETLIAEINTFKAYQNNVDRIENFYNRILIGTEEICTSMYEYSIEFASFILNADSSFDDKYDDLDELYDCIYEDAGDILYDEIYEDILDDLYDVFYDGLLDDSYDEVPYSEWSAARSNEYSLWSDTRSDVYSTWSDSRGDIYKFWSDIRSDIFRKDIEKALDTLQKFKEDYSRF